MQERAEIYEIVIEGHLDPHWSTRFEGMILTLRPDGTTVISGPVADQAALYAVLTRVRDLGVSLVKVEKRA